MITRSRDFDLGRDQTRIKDSRDAARQQYTVDALLGRFFTAKAAERFEIQVLADEVGMGKTFVALGLAYSILAHLKQERIESDLSGCYQRVLVLTPNNHALYRKWTREVAEFKRRCVLPEHQSNNLQFAALPVDRLDELAAALRKPGKQSQVIVARMGLFGGGKLLNYDLKRRFILGVLFRMWGVRFNYESRERLLKGAPADWPSRPDGLSSFTEEECERLPFTEDQFLAILRSLDSANQMNLELLLEDCREIAQPYFRNREYTTLADGSALASLILTAKLPVNEFSTTGAGAPGIGSISQSATGGSLPADVTLWVAVCAIDSNGVPSVPSNIAFIGTATASGGTFTLDDITWPAVAGLASYVLFVGTQPDLICAQATGTLTAGTGDTYTPGSITFGGPVLRSTWALPSPYVGKVRIKAKLLIHAGVAGIAVTSISTNTLVSDELIDTSSTPYNFTGRKLSLIGRPDGSTPFASFNITAHVPSTGTLTLDRDPTGIVNVGDAVVVRNKASGLSSTPASVTQITDPGYQNVTYSYSGMTPGVEVGNLIRVIAGTGRGQTPSTITANTTTQLTFQPPLTMDDTSIWIVEAPAWAFQADSTSIDNANPLTPVSLSVPTANFIEQAMLIAGFTVDVKGNESPDGDQPFREDWIYGVVGSPSGAMKISIPGTLAIGSNLGPAAFYTSAVSLQNGVTCMVKQAPVGADLVIQIYAGSTLLFTVTITAGSTTGSATGTSAIGAETPVIITITAVGTTFPGSDLTLALS